jgi:hypothetical protein
MAFPDHREYASVKLDAETIHKFESILREGLIASGAVAEADNKSLDLRAGHVTIELDAKALARLTELLREALRSGGAHEVDGIHVDAMTGRVR